MLYPLRNLIFFNAHCSFFILFFSKLEFCRQLHSVGVGRPYAGASAALPCNRSGLLALRALQLTPGHKASWCQCWNPVSLFLYWILKIVQLMNTYKEIHSLSKMWQFPPSQHSLPLTIAIYL